MGVVSHKAPTKSARSRGIGLVSLFRFGTFTVFCPSMREQGDQYLSPRSILHVSAVLDPKKSGAPITSHLPPRSLGLPNR